MTKVRDRILISAITNFAKYGFFNTSTSRIAKDANTSESSIYRFFQSKEEVLTEIFVNFWQEVNYTISKEITDYLNPEKNLKKLIKISLDYFLINLERTKVLLRESIPEGVNKTILHEEYNKFIKKIDEILLTGTKQGIFYRNLNIKILRQAVYGAMEQILYAFYIKEKTSIKKTDALKILYLFVDSIVLKK